MAGTTSKQSNNQENMIDVNVSLNHIIKDLLHYQEQLTFNAKEQKEHAKINFGVLKNAFNKLIDDKLKALIDQIDETEKSSLEKLQLCKQDAEGSLEKVNQFVEQHQNGDVEGLKALEELGNINLCSSNLISTHHFGGLSVQFLNETQALGQLNAMLSFYKVLVQPFLVITDVSPKMSSITVKWKVPEGMGIVSTPFLLQMLEVGNTTEYLDVYKGTQTSFIARHLKPNQQYSFRVSTLSTNLSTLWSVPKSTSTLDPTMKWKPDVMCTLSNSGATLSTISSSNSLFISSSRSFKCGQAMTIFVESLPLDIDVSEDGFGLSSLDVDNISPMNKGTLFLTSSGVVCVGLQKMTTRLPTIRKGTIITFDSQVLPSNKVRITIEVEEKVVTFDWTSQFDSGDALHGGGNNLYFFARLASPGWSVTVE